MAHLPESKQSEQSEQSEHMVWQALRQLKQQGWITADLTQTKGSHTLGSDLGIDNVHAMASLGACIESSSPGVVFSMDRWFFSAPQDPTINEMIAWHASKTKTPSPWSYTVKDDVVILSLSTPKSPINIFNDRAAEDLLKHLKNLPSFARGVIIATNKPLSFVNGVGLLKAFSANDSKAAAKESALVRKAYWALKALPLPTVAAIQGNCYGCGIELSLKCDMRVAVNSYDTHFYMTEIDEYLFVPVFGGTVELPRLVGLHHASRMLLEGVHVWGQEAQDIGLVHSLVEDQNNLIPEAMRLIEFPVPLSKKHTNTPKPFFFEQLPDLTRDIYEQAYAIMEQATDAKDKDLEPLYMQEMQAAGATLGHPASQNALPIFMVRFGAELLTHVRQDAPQDLALTLHGQAGAHLGGFLKQLKLMKLKIHVYPKAEDDADVVGDALQVAFDDQTYKARLCCLMHDVPNTTQNSVHAQVLVHLHHRVVELFALPKAVEASLARMFRRAGLTVVTHKNLGTSALLEIMDTHQCILQEACAQGITLQGLELAFFEHGFIRPVFGFESISTQNHNPTKASDKLAQRWIILWQLRMLDKCKSMLEEGTIKNIRFFTILLHDVLGYPKGQGIFSHHQEERRRKLQLSLSSTS